MMRDRFGVGLLGITLAVAACTVEGKEVATTFGELTASPGGTPPTAGGDSDDEMTGATSGSGGPAMTTTATTATATTSTQDDSTGTPVDEQPDSGMYAECMGVGQCIGLTTCVLVGDSGFCSNTNCGNALVQCDTNPGATSTAPPSCVDNGAGQMVCALSCAGGQSCPGGMSCLPLGASMVCA